MLLNQDNFPNILTISFRRFFFEKSQRSSC